MGKRYVWGRYTAIPQQGKKTRYSQTSQDLEKSVDVNVDEGETFYVGKSYYFSEVTGKYSLTNKTAHVLPSGYVYAIDVGYMVMTSGKMYYGEFRGVYGSLAIMANGLDANDNKVIGKEYGSYSYQEPYTYYIKGSFIEYVSSSNSGQYPSNSDQGGYYYVLEGSDNVDPTAVTVPDDIDDGTTIQISITPNTGKTFGGTISYTYQYRYDGGSWQTLSTTTATTVSLAVPKGQYSTLEVRVRAQDDMGFTSNTWVSSGSKTIIANQPPTAPGISVENVYIGNTLTVTLTAATDPDGTVASYVIQRRIDGGAWAQVQSGTSMTYSETVSGDWGTVAYRAAAVDNEGLQGPWATSQTFDVNPGWVIISGPENDLGDRPVPFPFEFEVGVAGHPAEDNIITQVLYDGRDLVVDRTFHDHDDIRINIDTKYYAAGVHTLQIIAAKEGYTTAMASYTFNIPAQKDELLELLESCKAEILQNPEAKAVVPFGLARFIYGEDGRDVNQMCGDGLKLAHGSYTGTGTSGSGSPNTLTCGFRPKVATIAAADGSAVIRLAAPAEGNTATAGGVTATFADSSLSWYADSAAAQLNASGTGYIYEIIG